MHQHDETEAPDLRTPTSPEALGLSPALMEDILLRRSVIEGRTPMTTLAEKLHISINVVDALLGSMRERKLIEYDGMEGRAYRVAATEAGRELSAQRSRETRYAGPMPVPLSLYTEVVRHQRPSVRLNQEMLSNSFSDLVISPTLLDQLGPAIHGEGAMFLYGPPGTGKSSVAERVVRAYKDQVLIPHCLEVDGQIISVFDPTLHEPVDEQPYGMDKRWVMCARPAVVTGGELHAGMLDLQLDRDTGVYLAPLQMKANSGVLVIDDFGRQAMTPEALLNRWIVPLDRQVDYLTLHGRKFEVPFEVKVVLSTNLDPSHLGDEAFFRRIHNKIYIGACTDDQFDWILARVAEKRGLEVDGTSAARLRDAARAQGDGELRAYLPGVVCELALAITAYEDTARQLTPQLVDRVLDLYFARLDGATAITAGEHDASFGVAGSTSTGAAPDDASELKSPSTGPAPDDASALLSPPPAPEPAVAPVLEPAVAAAAPPAAPAFATAVAAATPGMPPAPPVPASELPVPSALGVPSA